MTGPPAHRMGALSFLSAGRAVGVCMAAAGGVGMWAGYDAVLGSLSQPDAGLFPFFSGLAVLVASLLVFAGAPRRSDAEESWNAGAPAKLAALIGLLAGWILILPLTGFVLGTFVFVALFGKALGLEGWFKPAALGLAAALCIYVLFQRLLFIDLPTGIFG